MACRRETLPRWSSVRAGKRGYSERGKVPVRTGRDSPVTSVMLVRGQQDPVFDGCDYFGVILGAGVAPQTPSQA